MTQRIPSVPDLLDVFRNAPIGVPSPGEVERERARLLPVLEAEIRALPLRRARALRRRRGRALVLAASGFLAAAAAVILVLRASYDGSSLLHSASAPLVVHPPATVVSGDVVTDSRRMPPGSPLGSSSRVSTTPSSGAHLQSSLGYEMELGADTAVTFLPEKMEDGRQVSELSVSQGEVQFVVAPLGPRRALVVVTEDARMTVIGTRFLVRLESRAGGVRRTCVVVQQGVVSVTRSAADGGAEVGTRRLGAGESWGCEVDSSSGSSPRPAETRGAASAVVRREPAAPLGSSEGGDRGGRLSSLERQNQLLMAALSAERQGRLGEAENRFSELLRSHPDSPFLPEARAGLERIRQRR